MTISTISKEDFLTKLQENDLQSNTEGFEIKESVVIDSEVVNWKYREIRNVEFFELVRVSQVNIDSGLAFINCKFHKGITLRGLDCRKFDTSVNPYNTSVLFSNCTALHITFADLCKLDHGILIEQNSKIGIIRFYQTAIKNHGFNLKDSIIERTLDISKVKSGINVSKSTIGGVLRVENLEGDVSLIKSVFKGWVKFWAWDCKNRVILNYNTFEDSFEVEGSKIPSFSSIGDTFRKAAKIENRDTSGNNLETYLHSFYISEANISETFELDGLGKSIHEIKLPITPIFQGILRVINWKIKELRLSGINENLKLLISQCAIQRLIAIDFTNNAGVSLDRCKGERDIFPEEQDPDSTLIAAHSDFGPMKFNEFDFSSFQVINIDNVSFNEIFASNVKWFDDKNLIIGDRENPSEESFRRRREVYRQIKQSLRKIGNNIDALLFQSREMIAYRNEKKASKKYGVGDRLIMITNMTNNYGLSWLKPLGLVLLITLCYYFLIVPLLSNKLTYLPSLKCDNIQLTLTEFWCKKDVLFQLFNPARRFGIIYGESSTDWLYLWDALHRLILGVLIFQIIRAFRKYYRK